MEFLIDAQLPPAFVVSLRQQGHAAVHVEDVDLRDAEDNAIWQHAVLRGCVLITKDEDFAYRHIASPNGPSVVWLRIGNCSNRALLAWFLPLLPDIVARLASGERLIEVC